MDAIITDLLKTWGPPSIIAIVMWLMLQKSEKREDKKDLRIQYLENQLIENYDERIASADVISNALHENARALDGLIREIRMEKR